MRVNSAAVASAAHIVTGQSAAIPCGGNYAAPAVMSLAVNVTAVSGTTPTLDLTVEWSTDAGATWYKAQPVDSLTQITAVGTVVKAFTPKAPHFRLVWTIGGTTPSFTFAVDEVESP